MNTRTIADFFSAPAGTVIPLAANSSATIGEVVSLTSHPSGSAFDGVGVVVSASVNAQGFAVVRAISMTDPAFRVVVHTAEKV